MSDANDQAQGSGEKTYSAKEYEALQQKADNAVAKMVDLEKRFQAFGALGDIEAVKAKLTDYDNLRRDKAAGNREEVDKLIKAAREEESSAWRTKYTQAETAINDLTKQVRAFKIMDPAKTLAGELFVKGSVPFIVQHIEQIADLEGNTVIVKGQDGKPLRSEADPGKPMPLSEYLQRMAKENPDIAQAKGTGGGGSAGNTSSASSQGGFTAQQLASMSSEERARVPEEIRKALAPEVLKLLSKK